MNRKLKQRVPLIVKNAAVILEAEQFILEDDRLILKDQRWRLEDGGVTLEVEGLPEIASDGGLRGDDGRRDASGCGGQLSLCHHS